jgi:hypothetical protein
MITRKLHRPRRATGLVSRVPSESDAQAAYFDWLALIKATTSHGCFRLADFTFSVPNGTILAGTTQERARYMQYLKRRGLKPGVSDIVIALPANGYHGAYLELKRDKKARASDAQVIWRDRMTSVGYYARICVGLDELKAETMNYFRKP